MNTRIHVNPASLILVLALVGGGYWIYSSYEANRKAELLARMRAEEDANERAAKALEKAEREREEREADRKQQADADRQARLDAERIRAEAEKTRAAAELERQRMLAEERQKREEAEAAQRKAQEEARLRTEDERRRLEALDADQKRSFSVSEAQKELKAVRLAKRDLEYKIAEANRNIIAAKNRMAAAEKQKATAAAKAQQWASEQGIKVYDPDNPWGSIDTASPGAASQSENNAAVVVVQNNKEQILKEKANYERAQREVEAMTALLQKHTNDIAEFSRQVDAMTQRENAALETLARFGVDPEAKVAAFPDPKVQVDGAAPSKTIRMKDGSEIEADKVVDGGDVFSIKTTAGKFVTVKKTDVAEIPESLLPKK